MRAQRMFRVLTVAALIGGVSLAISGSAPTPAAAAAAMLAEFTWSGVSAAAGNAAFNLHCNWHSGPLCLDPPIYPDGTDDNATFPVSTDNPAVAWAVDLTDESIGDLTLEEDVNFDVVGGARTLTVKKLVIVGHDDAPTVVTMASGADITIVP